MSIFVGYASASRVCSGHAQPGCVELMAWFLAAFKSSGARNDGIYNCRNQRGSSAPSLHGEGRAADLGCPSGGGMQPLADWLVKYSAQLGVQCVIYNRHIWSGAHPSEGFRPYSGSDPHTTHLHVELSWAAANGSDHLTVARLTQVWAASHVKAGTRPAARPTLSRILRRGSSGLAVTNLQKELVRRGARLAVDGDFGPVTESWVRYFQRSKRLAVDGKVGRATATALGWVWTGTSSSAAPRPVLHGYLRQGSSGAAVRTLQAALGIRVDGDFGPVTKAAVVAFQRRRRLSADGIVGSATAGALGWIWKG